MIYCSYDWKKEIKKYKRVLECKYFYNEFKKEKSLFISAFIIRKLIECNKMTDYIDNYEISVETYKPLKHINRLNCFINDDCYDWDNKVTNNIKLKNLCNFLVHSYVFSFYYNENNLIEGFLVSSDYDRNKYLYKVEIKDWIEILEVVSKDMVTSMDMSFNEKKDDYISSKKF